METIEIQYDLFCKLLIEINDYKETIQTEQDTRVKIIDRIFTSILNWPYNEFYTEPPIIDGYIDYKFTINHVPRLILEAKKDSKYFEIENEYSGRALKLNAPILKSKFIQEGLKQAITYCAFCSVELACLSSGYQWIIFRGNRLGDGKEVLGGSAFVFTSLESIKDNFKLFYNLLANENISFYKYRAYFQEEEGDILRTKSFKNFLFPTENSIILSKSQYSYDFDKIMNLYFKKLNGEEDPNMLVECFIHTKESELADKKLGRIAEELLNKIRKINTDGPGYLAEIIERVKSTERNEFVIIIGTKGAGKSTFIDRFFKVVLSETLRESCTVLRINLGESDGNENKIIDWINTRLIEIAENVLYNGHPTYDELQGMFFNEYERWSQGPYRDLYHTNKTQFKIEFGKHIEERRENRPIEYLRRIIRDIVKSRKKIPCLIFDNADHFSIDFQEKVFQYSRAIYEEEICLILMPITDKTSWQLSRQGALQSFDNEALYLPTPAPRFVIQERIKYLEKKVREDKTFKSKYLIGKGIKLSIEDLSGFVGSLQTILISNNRVSTWIGNLANLDIRKCLELTRDLIASPYLNLENLIKMYIDRTTITVKEHQIIQSIIKDKYDIYPQDNHKFVHNIFFLTDEFNTSPLLSLRILQILIDKRGTMTSDIEFISINQIIDYFRAMGIDSNVMISFLDLMLKTGLCYSYDPTITDIKSVTRIQLSPSGKQHYYWGLYEENYIQCMIDTSPIYDQNTFRDLQSIKRPENREERVQRLSIFLSYLLDQDKKYCSVPDHEAYYSQKKLCDNINHIIQRNQRFNNNYQ